MSRQRRLWMLGMLSVVGVFIAGYAYASSCGYPLSEGEVLDMQLISVTYDGTPQVDPPEYIGMSGTLQATSDGTFFLTLFRQSRDIEERFFYAK